MGLSCNNMLAAFVVMLNIGDSSLLRLIWMIGFIIIEVILNLTISHGSSSG